jgi:hypothetical protein
MKNVILGTVLAIVLLTGCSEEDPKPLTCEQATAEYKAAFDNYYAKQEYLSRNSAKATLTELKQMQKEEQDAAALRTEKRNAMTAICGN